MRLLARRPGRRWAVEGASAVGTQLAQRLVEDGETVLDVPPRLSTRARIFDTGHVRKNDPGDAVALRLLDERRRERDGRAGWASGTARWRSAGDGA